MRKNSPLYSPQWVSTDQLPKDLYSEILPGLYMGGTHDDDVISNPYQDNHLIDKNKFDAVITMYASARPVDWNVQEIRFGIYDGSIEHIEIDRLIETAFWAYKKWKLGDNLLVRCQAGLNRSGLITALILMFNGLSAEASIQLIRDKRTDIALINHNFVDWLVDEASEVIQNFTKTNQNYIVNNSQINNAKIG